MHKSLAFLLIALSPVLHAVPLQDSHPVAQTQITNTFQIICGDSVETATAELVGNRQTIVTAAHVFWNKSCAPTAGDQGCRIYWGNSQVGELDLGAVKVGSTCPRADAKLDWAVAKLKTPLANRFQPAQPATSTMLQWQLDDGADIQLLAASQIDFPNYSQVACHLRRKDVFYMTDCWTQDGSSGAGVYSVINNITYLIGIHVGGRMDDPSHPTYDGISNYNFVIPLNGDFAAALQSVLKP